MGIPKITLHEALCKAAGWDAYCDKCKTELKRTSGLGGSYSYCPNPKCPDKVASFNEASHKETE